jgi:RHS repeat-associated protein
VGNPIAIAGSIGGASYATTFAYHPTQYFLTQGDGPWGDRSWTYDRIGNRITADREGDPTATYAYAGTGHTPKLSTLTPAPGHGTGSWTYTYDAAGNQSAVLEADEEGPTQTTLYGIAADGRMSSLGTTAPAGPSSTAFRYDGRGFLRDAVVTETGSPTAALAVTPLYSSDGLLLGRGEAREINTTDDETGGAAVVTSETADLFYFAGRPVAQRTDDGISAELLFISTDHLGTPALVTDEAGVTVWAGGLEPFGATWTAGEDNPDPEPLGGGLGANVAEAVSRLPGERVFLRYPGQWASDAFRVGGVQGDLYYNLHRWYLPQTGRYTTPDPLGLREGPNLFAYVGASPLTRIDPLGLAVWVCSRTTTWGFGNHAYFWDDRDGLLPDRRSCGRGPSGPELGPAGAGSGLPAGLGDQCRVIPGSGGREDELMGCCRTEREHDHVTGLWIPFAQDCGTMLRDCTEKLSLINPPLEFPGMPGGRLGSPCDRCEPVRLPDLPPPVPRSEMF